MRVNVNYSGDESQASEYTEEATKTALTGYLSSRKGWVTFEDITSNVSQLEAAEQGVIHQACFDCGYTKVDF